MISESQCKWLGNGIMGFSGVLIVIYWKELYKNYPIDSIILCAMAILFLFGFWLMMQSFILEAAEKQKKKDENNIREIAKQNKDLADELKEDHSAITQLQMDMGSIKNNLNTSSGIKEKGND